MKRILSIILCVLVGAGLIIVGSYYLIKEKDDQSSVKIYRIFIAIGILILVVSGIFFL